MNWNICQELQNIQENVYFSKSQSAVASNHMQDTVKKIYSGPIAKNTASHSYSIHTQVKKQNVYFYNNFMVYCIIGIYSNICLLGSK